MPESRIELTRGAIERYNHDGPAAMIEYLISRDALHPEFSLYIQEGLPNGGTYRGVEGYTQATTEWGEAWSSFSIEPLEFVEAGDDRVLSVVRQHAVAEGSGIEVGAEFFYVALFSEGRLREVHLYMDRALAEEAAGLK